MRGAIDMSERESSSLLFLDVTLIEQEMRDGIV